MLSSQHNKIYNIIKSKPSGSVFVLSDFYSISEPKTVSKVFERLCDDNVVVRVKRGVFWKKGAYGKSPAIPELVKAVSRIKNWKIIPTGKTALYELGLTTEEPNCFTYLTNGSDREYEFGDKKVNLIHSRSVDKKLSTESGILVETIKYYGKKIIPESIVEKVKEIYSSKQVKRIVVETKYMKRWIGNKVKNLFSTQKQETEKV